MPLTKITGGEFDSTQGGLSVAGIITATGGFIGTVTGNVTGAVSGNVTGNVIGNVTGNVTGNLVPSSGVTINSPASNTLAVVTNNIEKIRVGTAGSIGIGTDNPTKLIDISGNHSGISTTSRFTLTPHSGGWDIAATAGNIAPHYQTNLSIYSGQTGSGTLRWSIDSSGRVTKPSQPSFCASKNDSEQTTSGTVVFNIDSGAGRHNIGGHYSTSTGTFTAPVAGRYVFMCSIHSTNGTYRIDVRLRINGNDAAGGFALNNIDSYTQATGCVVLNLSANDAVTIYNNGSGVWPDAALTYFSGYLLG